MSQKVLLLILDGWGYNPNSKANAIEAANTPFYDSLLKNCPNTLLNASGVFVGLPPGIMGNSEVGHENIGAGRINKQKLTLISDLILNREFFENKILNQAFEHALRHNSKVHLMGLISEGDVHSHLGHLDALIEFAHQKSINPSKLYLHAISDGRDDPPYVAAKLLKLYQNKIQIASVAGRYWAMDRDNNWERLDKYLDCVLHAKGLRSSSASQAIEDAYLLAKQGLNPAGDSDEFVLPTLINENGLIQDGDSVIFFNFRPDRAKQISTKLGLESKLNDFLYTCFADYDVNLPIAFDEASLPEQNFSMTLGEVVSVAGLKQFRIAETEKYNHVTMFFNSRKKNPFSNEDRLLIPSPKVSTYDLKPEMSLFEVCDALVDSMDKDYQLIICNFANPDMVGHTGKWAAVIQAIEAIDTAIKNVCDKAKQTGHLVMITADHGNADQMYEQDGSIRTAHSCNLVPFIIFNSLSKVSLFESKSDENDIYSSPSLANIAPTILEYLELKQPTEMLAKTLIKSHLP